jgi:hypothetical protein
VQDLEADFAFEIFRVFLLKRFKDMVTGLGIVDIFYVMMSTLYANNYLQVNTLALSTDFVLRTGPFDHTGKRYKTEEEGGINCVLYLMFHSQVHN